MVSFAFESQESTGPLSVANFLVFEDIIGETGARSCHAQLTGLFTSDASNQRACLGTQCEE